MPIQIRTSLAVWFLLTGVLLVPELQAKERIASPFNVPAQNHQGKPRAKPFACPPVPAPVINLQGTSFYTDAKGSKIDQERFARANRQESPILGFTSQSAGIAADYAANAPHDPERLRCLVARLSAWARAGALLGTADASGINFRIWALVPLATSYILVAQSLPRHSEEGKRIRAWLTILANRNLQYVESRRIRNNIAYWAAAGAALASVATQRRDLLDRSARITEAGIATVDQSGALPLEMARGQRALAYHTFALTPLCVAAEVASANGIELFSLNNGALFRVGNRILAAQRSSSFFEKRAGAKQDMAIPFPAGALAWAEILYRHRQSLALEKALRGSRPIRLERAGGNVTFLYGRPLPPKN